MFFQVLYVCGRGFVWSLKQSNELESRPDPNSNSVHSNPNSIDINPNSIHSQTSQKVFGSSPLIKAALLYNLRVDQIIDLKYVLVQLREKFSENLEPILTKRFREISNLDRFVKILDLESKVHCNMPRSMLHEYFVRPHNCNLK